MPAHPLDVRGTVRLVCVPVTLLWAGRAQGYHALEARFTAHMNPVDLNGVTLPPPDTVYHLRGDSW